jgi:hypothetical protein
MRPACVWDSVSGAASRTTSHLVGPQFRGHRNRAPMGCGSVGTGVAMGEGGRAHPTLERLVVPPPGDDQPLVTSVGRSSSNPSKPSCPSTAPARAANRRASSSPASSGTVMALILISVMEHDLIRPPGLAHVEPSPSSPSTLGTAGSRVAQDAESHRRAFRPWPEAEHEGGRGAGTQRRAARHCLTLPRCRVTATRAT